MNLITHIIRSWWPAVLLVLMSYGFTYLGFFTLWPSFDVPMHFLGGLLVAYAMDQHLHALPRQYFSASWSIRASFVLSLTAVVTIAWETFELLQDELFGMVSQLGIQDALADMWIGLIGGAIYLLVQQHYARQKTTKS